MRFSRFGVTEHKRELSYPGATLFSPLLQNSTYLIGMNGEILHQWSLESYPGNYAHLLPNGNLLAAINTPGGPSSFNAKGGKIQEISWDGAVVWEYQDDNQHHDFRRCDNGNTIYLGWELLPPEAAERVQGGRPGTEKEDGVYGDYIREVNPAGETVWEWHAHENLEIEKYPNASMAPRSAWAHPNSIQPLPNGDVLVSWRHNNLIAVIDRQTGQFSFEWMGVELGHQHDFQKLKNGNYMVFCNVPPGRGPGQGSKVLEFDPQTKATVWEYQGTPKYTFASPFISGAQRLKNGNTLICEGQWGRIFEVTPNKEVVWEYISPFFVPSTPGTNSSGTNCIFRAYRYDIDGPEIQNRVILF